MEKHILVIDDEQDVTGFLADLLEDHGYSVATAQNGDQAMQQIKIRKPDLILLDLLMPEETGTAFYRKLHEKKELKNIPVIFVSGLAGRPASVSKTIPVIDKPIEEKHILKEIKKLLHY